MYNKTRRDQLIRILILYSFMQRRYPHHRKELAIQTPISISRNIELFLAKYSHHPRLKVMLVFQRLLTDIPGKLHTIQRSDFRVLVTVDS